MQDIADNMNIYLLNDYLLVKADEFEEGILLPESVYPACKTGTVKIKGKNFKNIKRGDRILYKNRCGVKIQIKESDYLILKKSDVLGLIFDE